MGRVPGAGFAPLILLIVGVLAGCSPLDVYAFRAVQYNFEAEETQNQVILLNIARSALHRPMEFTEITNIVGGNSVSGNTSFSFPVGFRLPTGVTTGTAGASVGGSTTFTIPVLDTQDFYEGLLNDIQPSLLAYYLQSPFISKELLLNLFVERIVVHVSDDDRNCPKSSHSTTCERDFQNNPIGAEDMALFQTFVRYLLSMQVSAEPVKAASTAQTIKANGATINISGASSGTSSDSSAGAGGSTPYRLCFNPRISGQGVPPTANCGNAPSHGDASQIKPSTTIDGVPFPRALAEVMLDNIANLTTGSVCPEPIKVETLPHDSDCYQESLIAFADHKIQITLQFRSTGSIFNFLGQLVSAADEGRFYPLYAHSSFHAYAKDWPPCWLRPSAAECKPIIAVRPAGEETLVSVTYNASIYAVPGDPKVSFSPDVFTILKQLIALNLSGKNLPTTAIFSVTSTQ